MASERDIVDSAFEGLITSLFKTYFESSLIAQGNAASQQAALDHFRQGVIAARAARDAAKAVVA